MNTDVTKKAEEYYRPMQHVRVHDVFDYNLHQGKLVYAFHVQQIIYAIQKYMYSVLKLNKLISYYFYTYIFDGNFALGCGPEHITP